MDMNKKTLAIVGVILSVILVSSIGYYLTQTKPSQPTEMPSFTPSPEPTPIPIILPEISYYYDKYGEERYNETSNTIYISYHNAIFLVVENETSTYNYWIRFRRVGMTKWTEMDCYSFLISDAGKIYNDEFVNNAFVNKDGNIVIIFNSDGYGSQEFQVGFYQTDNWSESLIVKNP